MKVAIIVIAIVALVIIGTLLVLWALNALFGLAIPYTLKTWAAALILGGLVEARSTRSTS